MSIYLNHKNEHNKNVFSDYKYLLSEITESLLLTSALRNS